jgi:NAD(P)-dependent dehydrogenase (short-subunit alcohol dehydrogenase family)
MTASINGRVVAITGGARGIGLATARALRAAGAKVAIGDLDLDATTAAAESIGSDVLGAQLNVTDAASFKDFLDLVERELGPLDVLINNAGIMPIGPFLEEKHDTAGRVLDVNVGGCMIGMKSALARMTARRSGHIINVASVAGKSPVPGGMSYAASKAGVVSLTESARVEFRGQGVDFTCVMPSFTATDLIAGTKGVKFIKNVTPEAVAAAIVAAVGKPKNDVFVPKAVAVPIVTGPIMGRRFRDFVNRLIGADKTFLDVDRNARAYYEDRISEKERDSEKV